MSTARHAERILEAWHLASAASVEAELDSALLTCNREIPSSEIEKEHRAVLESVVWRLRYHSGSGHRRDRASVQAGLSLLRHLQTRY